MELIKKLYLTNSKTCHEEAVKAIVMGKLASLDVKVEEDSFGNLFVTKGKADVYPCVAAHLDEVHFPVARNLVVTGDVISAVDNCGERVGIGADDKNGVWIALRLLRSHDVLKCAFFVQEEKNGDVPGCRGSNACDLSWFNDVKYVLQCDRKGNSDLVINGKGTELCSFEFIPVDILRKFGYWVVRGSSTDVVMLKKRGLQVPVCNISCGYYNAHHADEYSVFSEMEKCFQFVDCIIKSI